MINSSFYDSISYRHYFSHKKNNRANVQNELNGCNKIIFKSGSIVCALSVINLVDSGFGLR